MKSYRQTYSYNFVAIRQQVTLRVECEHLGGGGGVSTQKAEKKPVPNLKFAVVFGFLGCNPPSLHFEILFSILAKISKDVRNIMLTSIRLSFHMGRKCFFIRSMQL